MSNAISRTTEDSMTPYIPRHHQRVLFHRKRIDFIERRDTPRAFLEHCLSVIEDRENSVRAFASLNVSGARKAADASDARYRAGRALSPVDGLPLGIKDVFETEDMPTEMNSPAYSGWHSHRDAAHVYVLRRGGAIILGKTVTTEFAQGASGPTRNPFDLDRTPGGSSSSSAAAVASGMVPVAMASQARGSIIRPASFCGNYALKPTFGALNSQGIQGLGAPSQCTVGLHADSLEDIWTTAFYISSKAGGDPGEPGLFGEPDLGTGKRIQRIVRLDTLGWESVEPETRDAFEGYIRRLEALGVEVVTRDDDQRVEDFEQAIRKIPDFMWPIFLWEMLWAGRIARDRGPSLISPVVLERLEKAESMSLMDYRLAIKQRDELYAIYSKLSSIADICTTLCSTGPAPLGTAVGNPVFADLSSNLRAPAISVPLLAVQNLPVGVQLLGFRHGDFGLSQQALWLANSYFVE